MTEKEFENLKIGDEVWVGVDWFSDNPKKDEITSFKVEGKEWGEEATGSVVFCGGVSIKRHRCFLTKTEAWEYKVKCYEEFLVNHKKALARYKAELSKAKEEEEVCWITDSGDVRKVRKSDYPCYIHYATEREAYEALAKFYKGKYEEALGKAGEIGYTIFSGTEPRILTVFNPTMEDGYPVGVDYDGCRFAPVCSGWFNTRQEAEAELERRKV